MYASFDRVPSHCDLLGDRQARDPALDNSADYKRLLRVHAEHALALLSGRSGVRPIGPLLMRRIVDTRTLRAAAAGLRRRGPEAPGPGGLRLEHVSDGETWELCRTLRELLKTGDYRRVPAQRVRIPKEHKPGQFRELTIQSTPDRIVGKAAALILGPVVDGTFSQFSFGFRPHRDRHHALAGALALARAEHRWAAVAADISQAFDRVPFDRVLNASCQHFPEDVITFINRIANVGKDRGLPQGSPFSPLLFNIFADHYIDRSWQRAHPDLPLFRYVDDLLLLCRDSAEAAMASSDLTRRVRSAGTPLKDAGDGSGIVDMAGGQELQWLGFLLRREGPRIAIRIGNRSWNRLGWNFAKANLSDAAPLRARQIVCGWIDQMGPTYPFEDRQAVLEKVRDIAAAHAFDEVQSGVELSGRWTAAHARWQRVYKQATESLAARRAGE